MLNNNLKVTINGLERINEDVRDEIAYIDRLMPQALQYVGSEMQSSLKEHLQNDWYSAYYPQYYDRRTDDLSLGTPLGSDRNMTISVDGSTLTLVYDPIGDHKNPIWSHRASGDDLIQILQDGTGGGWEGKVPPRPFWDLFVAEQINGGIITALQTAFSRDYSLLVSGGDVGADGRENIN